MTRIDVAPRLLEWAKDRAGLSDEDLATAYREFRGKDPSVEPLLKNRGLK